MTATLSGIRSQWMMHNIKPILLMYSIPFLIYLNTIIIQFRETFQTFPYKS